MNKVANDIKMMTMLKIANYNIKLAEDSDLGFIEGIGKGMTNQGDLGINAIGAGLYGLLGNFSNDIGKNEGMKYFGNTAYNSMDMFGNMSHPEAGIGYKIGNGIGNALGAIPPIHLAMMVKSLLDGSYDVSGALPENPDML